MIGVQKVGDWRAAVSDLTTYARQFRRVSKQAIMQEAHYWSNRIKSGIRTQRSAGKAKPPWAPLAQSTIERKGSSKILIDTGAMLRSIGVDEVVEWSKYFMGVKRGSKSADGEDLVNIAAVHEFGYSIKSGRSGGEVIVLPKRSFIEPVAEEEFSRVDIGERILTRYSKLMQKFLQKKVSVPSPKELK